MKYIWKKRQKNKNTTTKTEYINIKASLNINKYYSIRVYSINKLLKYL